LVFHCSDSIMYLSRPKKDKDGLPRGCLPNTGMEEYENKSTSPGRVDIVDQVKTPRAAETRYLGALEVVLERWFGGCDEDEADVPVGGPVRCVLELGWSDWDSPGPGLGLDTTPSRPL